MKILICGAGPVGLSLALGALDQGIEVEVIEAGDELSNEIRASTFHPPTLEMLASWSVLDAVVAAGQPVERLAYWERAARRKVAEFDYRLIAGDTAFPFRLQCPQHVFTRCVLPRITGARRAAVHFGHRLVDLEQDERGVTAIVETTSGRRSFRGDYLCAADGAKSTVRERLGIGFAGLTYQDRFLLIGTDIDLAPVFPGLAPVNYMFDPEAWAIILHLRDRVRIVFRLRPDEDAEAALADRSLFARLEQLVGTMPPVLSRSIYRVHQRVAATFRQGRVLLLGDAAHVNNPAGGMGMNSGIHDARVLAGALGAVAGGRCEAVLDAYATARRRVALEDIQRHTHERYQDMVLLDPADRAARNRRYAEIAADPARARVFLLEASMMADRLGAPRPEAPAVAGGGRP